MKLMITSLAAVHFNLHMRQNPHIHYCSSLNGYVSVGDFVFLMAAINIDGGLNVGGNTSFTIQLIKEFRAIHTFGQVMNVYDSPSSEEVFFKVNNYLNPDGLPSGFVRFNRCVPPDKTIVQTDLCIEVGSLQDVQGSGMVIRMHKHDTNMEYLLSIFIDSINWPKTLCLLIKSTNLHIRSSLDLFRVTNPWFVSQPEVQYTHLVKVDDCGCKKMCIVSVG
jgi:hypothetical protein